MKSLLIIGKEHTNNIYLLIRLSFYEMKIAYFNNHLGILWMIINPLLQIFVYWMVFGLGIRGGASVEGVPYFIWLICALIPWFYAGAGITQGSNAIYQRLGTVSKMKFPLSIIPTVAVVKQMYTHFILLILLVIVVWSNRGITALSLAGVAYFVICLTVFLIALSFITSTLATIVRDVQMVVQATVRMLFFLTPIMWTMSIHTPNMLKKAVESIPLYYIVNGYRSALLWGDVGSITSNYTLVFWGIVLVMLLIGSVLHVRFRKLFVDYL